MAKTAKDKTAKKKRVTKKRVARKPMKAPKAIIAPWSRGVRSDAQNAPSAQTRG